MIREMVRSAHRGFVDLDPFAVGVGNVDKFRALVALQFACAIESQWLFHLPCKEVWFHCNGKGLKLAFIDEGGRERGASMISRAQTGKFLSSALHLG